MELGRAGLAGGGEIGACHAAPQRDDAGAEDAQRPLYAQLNGLTTVGQEIAVLVDGSQAHGGTVPGGAVGQDGIVDGAFQPDALHRLLHDGADGPAMPHGLEAVNGGGAAQHTDIFVVKLHQLIPAQAQ